MFVAPVIARFLPKHVADANRNGDENQYGENDDQNDQSGGHGLGWVAMGHCELGTVGGYPDEG